MRLMSAAENPPSMRVWANIAKPSDTGGLMVWPRSVERTQCSGLALRMLTITSSQRAFFGQFGLLVGGETLRRKLGVRHKHSLQLHFARTAHQGEDLFPSQMAGGHDHIVIANDLQTAASSFVQVAFVIQHRQRRWRDSHGG